MHTTPSNRPMAAVYTVTSAFRLNALRLLVLGGSLVCLGGVADIAYHAAPATLRLEPFVGAEGIRAHLLTLAGMVVALAGVMARGLHR
jgi:hypothetical protein